MKFSSKGLLILAVALSLLVAVLVGHYLYNVQPTAKEDSSVVMAKADIPPNTIITSEMVETVKIPGTFLQPGAITDASRVVGVYSRELIHAREQITDRLVLTDAKAAGFAGLIPNDKRAISISVNDVTGVSGLIKPGDYTDMIVMVDGRGGPVANMLFQRIQVLAVNKNVSRGESGSQLNQVNNEKAGTLTLAVTPDQATAISLAGQKGAVTFALRPPTVNTEVVVSTKSLNSLRGDDTGYVPATAAPAPAPAPRAEYQPSSSRSISVIKGTKEQSVSTD